MRLISMVLTCAVFAISITSACTSKPKASDHTMSDTIKVGTYGYDIQFLKKYNRLIELKDGDARVAIVPEYQGRVMTSSCQGEKGFSFGWINYDLIASQKVLEHINPFGGEERFWLGPEGGQFSLYFNMDEEFVFDNWYVPAPLDTEGFDLVRSNESSAIFKKNMLLQNYSGTRFKLNVVREIYLLSPEKIRGFLEVNPGGLSMVAYETLNSVENTGEKGWEKETGLLSIWMLGMLIPSPEVTVVIPVLPGDEENLGPKVNDDYFGKISSDRLHVKDRTIFFKADGKSRGKIGIPPLRATRFMGSYDGQNKALTILECILPEGSTEFVNSAWELQEDPYSGDALNSYNDGPLEDGSQMGPFYELESSSPALALDPGQSYTHIQRTYHFTGEREDLDRIARKVLGSSLDEIEEVF